MVSGSTIKIEEFRDLFLSVAAIKVSLDRAKALAPLYFEAIKDYPYDDVYQAYTRWATSRDAERDKLPTPFQFLCMTRDNKSRRINPKPEPEKVRWRGEWINQEDMDPIHKVPYWETEGARKKREEFYAFLSKSRRVTPGRRGFAHLRDVITGAA